MGLTPFACITLQDCVRVVYPDGHVENLSRPCSVQEFLLGNPDYYVCGSTPYISTNRMAAEDLLEYGVTYFVCATPNAQPFMEHQPKKADRGSKLLPRFSRHGIQGREMRSAAHGSAQSRKVFDFHSATMQQQLESMRKAGVPAHHRRPGDRPPKHLLKLVFIRHCLQALRLPRNAMDLMEQSFSEEAAPPPAPPAMNDEITQIILKSAARSELGLYVSRRQEFYLRRARRRRKIAWKPVLQSISEMAPIVEFLPPVAQQDSESGKPGSSPPPAAPKNISPPRQQGSGGPPKSFTAPLRNISPPRQPVFAAPRYNNSQPKQPIQRREAMADLSTWRSLWSGKKNTLRDEYPAQT